MLALIHVLVSHVWIVAMVSGTADQRKELGGMEQKHSCHLLNQRDVPWSRPTWSPRQAAQGWCSGCKMSLVSQAPSCFLLTVPVLKLRHNTGKQAKKLLVFLSLREWKKKEGYLFGFLANNKKTGGVRGKVETVFGISVRAVISPPYYLTFVPQATDFLSYPIYLKNPGICAF